MVMAAIVTGLHLAAISAAGGGVQDGAPPQPPPSATPPISGGLPEIQGPPPPVAPATISRDTEGQATMRAVRIRQPLDLDGRLDDEVYARIPGASGFIQQFPREGQPATEATEVWIFFDDHTLYVSGWCHETEPDRAVATELRRDHNNIFQGDNITVVFDTYYDRRNGFFFQTNRLGALRALVERFGGVVVLKGAGSLVLGPSGRPWVCTAT